MKKYRITLVSTHIYRNYREYESYYILSKNKDDAVMCAKQNVKELNGLNNNKFYGLYSIKEMINYEKGVMKK